MICTVCNRDLMSVAPFAGSGPLVCGSAACLGTVAGLDDPEPFIEVTIAPGQDPAECIHLALRKSDADELCDFVPTAEMVEGHVVESVQPKRLRDCSCPAERIGACRDDLLWPECVRFGLFCPDEPRPMTKGDEIAAFDSPTD